ncbi:MAG TPA: flavodoxin-dependent (E)-4-hydroxy-3-methylbut-2-enyl-diphosphate synthase [Firmicutes bacterium]|nr:flavodoxin-dependent (E)-4-hydroxy-3-methylbut-2-enyl-diphosphate synthase [Bacillota bacterium]
MSSRAVTVRGVKIGGGAPVVVQGMTKSDTRDVEATLTQIRNLAAAGAKLVRVAIPDEEALSAFRQIRLATDVPLIADIHFNPELAVKAIGFGADKIRINPGNIGGERAVERVVRAAKQRGVPLRLGINSGSLEKDILEKYGAPTAEAMVESCLRWVRFIEELEFHELVVSLKSSSVEETVHAYRLAAQRIDYPMHVGVTEAGAGRKAVIKSAVGIGALLLDGIGDTVRVSLTGDPAKEIEVAYDILRACGRAPEGVEIISCPACGRCRVNLERLVSDVERLLRDVKKPLKVAVMGCAVNGPGEAKHADAGIACGAGQAVVFAFGKQVAVVREEEAAEALSRVVHELEER